MLNTGWFGASVESIVKITRTFSFDRKVQAMFIMPGGQSESGCMLDVIEEAECKTLSCEQPFILFFRFDSKMKIRVERKEFLFSYCVER